MNIAEIKTRAEAATCGSWFVDKQCEGEYAVIVLVNHAITIDPVCKGDAEFIAHAREDIPALLAELDRLTAEKDAAVEDMRICAYDEAGENHGACICNFCARALNCPDEHRDPEEQETRCDFKWRGKAGE